LAERWVTDRTAKTDRRFHKRIVERLDALEEAAIQGKRSQ
jgi:hypothetical protein